MFIFWINFNTNYHDKAIRPQLFYSAQVQTFRFRAIDCQHGIALQYVCEKHFMSLAYSDENGFRCDTNPGY